jgi:putative glycerol-1-phosphate prenyltransferase
MQEKVLLNNLIEAKRINKKLLFLLVDPDDFDETRFDFSTLQQVDALLVGGSLISSGNLNACVKFFKQNVTTPIIIFPGTHSHISNTADAILLLSLISGRNAELLIGQHVSAAFALKKSNLEILPTGYILIDGGKPTTVSYISNTQPIPADKPMIAAATAIAGEQLGLSLIYMDTGSGALNTVSDKIVNVVSQNCSIPLIIGGGIRKKEDAIITWKAGATAIVIGNAAEKNPKLIDELIIEKNKLNLELIENI